MAFYDPRTWPGAIGGALAEQGSRVAAEFLEWLQRHPEAVVVPAGAVGLAAVAVEASRPVGAWVGMKVIDVMEAYL